VVEEEEDSEVNVRRLRAVTTSDVPKTGGQEPASAEEPMAVLQLQDPDVGPILKLRLRQTNQPRPKDILTESEAVKILWGQWHSLVAKDGVLCRRLYAKNGRPSALQLVVPTQRRTEFIGACHQGMTGGHRAFRSTLVQVRRRGFWLVGAEMSRSIVVSAKVVLVTTEDTSLDLDRCNRCLPATSWKGATSTSLVRTRRHRADQGS